MERNFMGKHYFDYAAYVGLAAAIKASSSEYAAEDLEALNTAMTSFREYVNKVDAGEQQIRLAAVRFEGEDETEEYVLVTSIRGDSMHGYITIESPVGRALVGKKAGDIAHVTLPDGGGYDLEVVSVSADVDDDNIEIRRF